MLVTSTVKSKQGTEQENDPEESEDEVREEEPETESTISSFDEALQVSQNLMQFVMSHGLEQAAENLHGVIQSLQDQKIKDYQPYINSLKSMTTFHNVC